MQEVWWGGGVFPVAAGLWAGHTHFLWAQHWPSVTLQPHQSPFRTRPKKQKQQKKKNSAKTVPVLEGAGKAEMSRAKFPQQPERCVAPMWPQEPRPPCPATSCCPRLATIPAPAAGPSTAAPKPSHRGHDPAVGRFHN